MTEVHMTDCTSLSDFQRLVAPLTVSRHMNHFFKEKTFFYSQGYQPDGYEARYLTSDTQIIALWVSAKNNWVRDSYGTYVERAYRRKGLASLLWAHEPLSNIQGTSCSTAGYRFLSALKQKRRNITFVDCRQA